MASLTFPLPHADFAALLEVASVENFRPSEASETNRLADGTILRARRGEPLWIGDLVLNPCLPEEALAREAILSVLLGPGASFLVGDPRYRGPRGDPGGVVLGSAAPTLAAVSGDRRRVGLAGLPTGYVLQAGDMAGWLYGPGEAPVLRALHRIVAGDVADASGEAEVEVFPAVRDFTATGVAVELVAPVCKAILVSSEFGGGMPAMAGGERLSFVQTLR